MMSNNKNLFESTSLQLLQLKSLHVRVIFKCQFFGTARLPSTSLGDLGIDRQSNRRDDVMFG